MAAASSAPASAATAAAAVAAGVADAARPRTRQERDQFWAAWLSRARLSPAQEKAVADFASVLTEQLDTPAAAAASRAEAADEAAARALRELVAWKYGQGAAAAAAAAAAVATAGAGPPALAGSGDLQAQLDAMRSHAESVRTLAGAVQEIDRCLRALEEQYRSASSKTQEVHEECRRLLDEQTRLAQSAEAVHAKLDVFDDAERLASRLSISSDRLLLSDEFVVILRRLDDGVAFMQAHASYREAPRYLLTFQDLQGRAIDHIRALFAVLLERAAKAAEEQMHDTILRGDFSGASSAHAFVEFRSAAQVLRRLVSEVEARAEASASFKALLRQCLQTYFLHRDRLLGDHMRAFVSHASKHHQLPDLTRVTCTYLVELCSLEYQLFQDFFAPNPTSSEFLQQVLAQLCGALYTQLRPAIIHELDVDRLCEAVLILQSEIVEAQVVPRGDSARAVGHVVRRIVEDVQERLSYRAHVSIRDEIERFQPSRADIDYPTRLGMPAAPAAAGAAAATADANGEGKGRYNPYASCFPTLERTLMLLSKTYPCLERSVFQYLAQESVSACVHSLVEASAEINAARRPADALLFLIKHLLILREQISPFDVDFSVTKQRLDFSHVSGVLPGVLRQPGLRSLLAVVQQSEPKLRDQRADSKKDMEEELQHACEGLIALMSSSLVGRQVQELLRRAAEHANLPPSPQQGDSGPMGVLNATNEVLRQLLLLPPPATEPAPQTDKSVLESQLLATRALIGRYLSSPVTEKILFKSIKARCADQLQHLRHWVERCQRLGAGEPADAALAQLDAVDKVLASVD